MIFRMRGRGRILLIMQYFFCNFKKAQPTLVHLKQIQLHPLRQGGREEAEEESAPSSLPVLSHSHVSPDLGLPLPPEKGRPQVTNKSRKINKMAFDFEQSKGQSS